MRRFAMIALSLSLTLTLGLTATPRMFAQDPAKTEAPKTEAPKSDATKTEAAKPEAPKAKPIPPEVEAKLEAARRAVAEAIVAAQDAGLVETSIDPPPILDILITGQANDEAALKARTGVSPEVFGAWFTDQGKTAGIIASKDVRIVQPSAGLKSWYDERKSILARHIKAVRDAKAPAEKKEEAKPKDEPKKEEAKPKDEPKKEEPKAEEPKKEEAKKEEPKAEEPKKEEAKKEEPKAEEPKKEEAKKEEPKAEAPKAEEPKKEEPKTEAPK